MSQRERRWGMPNEHDTHISSLDKVEEQINNYLEEASDVDLYKYGPIVNKLLSYTSFFDCIIFSTTNPIAIEQQRVCFLNFIKELPQFLNDYEQFYDLDDITESEYAHINTGCNSIYLCTRRLINTHFWNLSDKLFQHLNAEIMDKKTKTRDKERLINLLKQIKKLFPRIVQQYVIKGKFTENENIWAQNYVNSGRYIPQKIGGKKHKKRKTRQKKRQSHKKFRKTLKRRAFN